MKTRIDDIKELRNSVDRRLRLFPSDFNSVNSNTEDLLSLIDLLIAELDKGEA